MTKARYDVKRAELDTVPHEFLPRMEREQKMLKLSDANAKLGENERKLKALSDIEKAELASKIEKRDKARFDLAARRAAARQSRHRFARRWCGVHHAELAPVLSAARLQVRRPCVAGPGDRRIPDRRRRACPLARRSRTRTHAAWPARGRPRRRGARQGAGGQDSRTSARLRASIFPVGRRSAIST